MATAALVGALFAGSVFTAGVLTEAWRVVDFGDVSAFVAALPALAGAGLTVDAFGEGRSFAGVLAAGVLAAGAFTAGVLAAGVLAAGAFAACSSAIDALPPTTFVAAWPATFFGGVVRRAAAFSSPAAPVCDLRATAFSATVVAVFTFGPAVLGAAATSAFRAFAVVGAPTGVVPFTDFGASLAAGRLGALTGGLDAPAADRPRAWAAGTDVAALAFAGVFTGALTGGLAVILAGVLTGLLTGLLAVVPTVVLDCRDGFATDAGVRPDDAVAEEPFLPVDAAMYPTSRIGCRGLS
ncbi:MAG: hypothetical protein ACKOBM_17670 [Gammaproteobacteria bacterium]